MTKHIISLLFLLSAAQASELSTSGGSNLASTYSTVSATSRTASANPEEEGSDDEFFDTQDGENSDDEFFDAKDTQLLRQIETDSQTTSKPTELVANQIPTDTQTVSSTAPANPVVPKKITLDELLKTKDYDVMLALKLLKQQGNDVHIIAGMDHRTIRGLIAATVALNKNPDVTYKPEAVVPDESFFTKHKTACIVTGTIGGTMLATYAAYRLYKKIHG